MLTATIVGAALRPGYSHIADSISELTEAGAPNKMLLDAMIGAYHLLFIPFAYGLHLALPRGVWLGPALLGVAGLLGLILTGFFPCDAGCEANPTTIAGKGHGVILAVNVLCVFTGMVAVFWRIRLNPSWRTYARYTLISALAALGLGLATMPLLNTAYTGLGERLALIPIELWFVVSGLLLWRSAGNRWDAS